MTSSRTSRRARAGMSVVAFVAAAASFAGCSDSPGADSGGSSDPTSCDEALARAVACGAYTSTGGDDGGTEMMWLADDPLSLTVGVIDGSAALVVVTPCNVVNVFLDVRDDHTAGRDVASGLKGCDEEAAAREIWAAGFFGGTVEWTRTQEGYLARNGDAVVELRRG